jgi:hypothetical protein
MGHLMPSNSPGIKKYQYLLWGSCLLLGCSGLEQSEQEKLRAQNATGEYIYRSHDEQLYAIPPPTPRTRAPYPWEERSP